MNIKEQFTTPKKYPTPIEAKRARDARARDLRKDGYSVTCKKFDFGGLGYGMSFVLEASKPDDTTRTG